MRLIIFTILFCLNFLSVFAQDYIYLKNNDSIKCIIIEDKIVSLNYKLFDRSDTTTYNIKKEDYDYYVDNIDPIFVVCEDAPKNEDILNKLDIGIGHGIDYGGIIGFNLSYYPIGYASVFISIGNQIIAPSTNVGIRLLVLQHSSKNYVRPNIKLMYGVNSSIIMTGAEHLNKLYPGFTYGVGLQTRFGKTKKHGFDFDINLPIYSDEFIEDYNKIKSDPKYRISNYPSILISMGYHIEF